MPVAKPPPPDLKWSFDLPDRLKLAIADAVVLHSRLESLCLECIWEIEQADLERKKETAKNWASENYKLLKKALATLPGERTDKIWRR